MSTDEILKLFTVLGVLLTIIVSFFTATQSASKNGFEQLERLVNKLEKQVSKLEVDLADKNTELEKLRDRVDILEAENKCKDDEIMRLTIENERLKKTPPSHGLGMRR